MNTKSSAREKKYFRIYYGMGPERSLRDLASKLHQDCKKLGIKAPPSYRTIADWSSKYNWTKRIDEWDRRVAEKLDQEALEQAVVSNEQILKIASAVIFTFAKQLKGVPVKRKDGTPVFDKDGKPIMAYSLKLTPFDVKLMYDLQQQILRGRPVSNINVFQSIVVRQAVQEIENLPNEDIKKQIIVLLNKINELIDVAYGGNNKKDSLQIGK